MSARPSDRLLDAFATLTDEQRKLVERRTLRQAARDGFVQGITFGLARRGSTPYVDIERQVNRVIAEKTGR